MIRTSVVGSYPPGDLDPEKALERAVADQWTAGIDMISDGQVRADMIQLFAQAIPGFSKTTPYCIDGPIGPSQGTTVLADWRRAQTLLEGLKPGGESKVKGILTGPTTLALSCRIAPEAPYRDKADPQLIRDLAAALAVEARALIGAGVEYLQVDEPFFSLGADLELGLEVLKPILADVPRPILHVCGEIRGISRKLLKAPAAILDIESFKGILPDWTGADLSSAGITVGLGVLDASSDRVEGEGEVRQAVERGIQAFGRENLAWISPDCGLRLRDREAALAKLQVMTRVARDY